MSITTRSNRPNINSGSLGQFLRSREVMFHESAPIRYRDNPQFNPSLPDSALNPSQIPFVLRPARPASTTLAATLRSAKNAQRA